VLLFQGSTDLTEKITAARYPAYAGYQKRVPRFLPKFWARRRPATPSGS